MLQDSIQDFPTKLENGRGQTGHGSARARTKHHIKPETAASCSTKHRKSQTKQESKSICQRRLSHHTGMQKMGVGYNTQIIFLYWKCPRCNTTSSFGHSGKLWKLSTGRPAHSLSRSENFHMTRKQSKVTRDWETCSTITVVTELWACWPVVQQMHQAENSE